ncbi:septation protein SepH [Serinicoccus kebangsaanensis]|uniref:septation protein SepH n=1 Tax=Serinicoccus kebangsaanensis TaxID=2602069 RepID=UPI00124D5796|nr:septation protein SepH [Serinicoccus kebangsaanensis]
MQQLQFVELDEGGRLVLADDDGSQYAVRIDDRLRAALRPRRQASEGESAHGRSISPRDVQAMIRGGQSAEDVAASTGWELDRVRRFEGPVIAEREHVVGLAQRAPVRASGRSDGSHTLDRRVRERLQSRGVDLTAVSWDAARGEPHGPWTIIVAFGAGGRERRAAWHYDVRARAVEALDDEARWLSEDEQALPGGLAGHPLLGRVHGEDEAAADLMATMRERRQRRGRRGQGGAARQGSDDPGHLPGRTEMPDEVLPLEDLPYDPDTMGDPPPAHPRGSAPESVSPVEPEEDELVAEADVAAEADVTAEHQEAPEEPPSEEQVAEPLVEPERPSPEEAQRAVGKSRGRKRRRLRLPSVAPASDEHDEAEGTFARTRHDPQEVTFDEFFGVEDEDEEPLPEQQEDLLEPVEDEVEVDVPAEDGPSADELDVADEVDVDEVDDAPDEVDDAPDEPGEPVADAEPDIPEPDEEAAEDEARPAPTRKGRTSVPSWDDIMFGSRPNRG